MASVTKIEAAPKFELTPINAFLDAVFHTPLGDDEHVYVQLGGGAPKGVANGGCREERLTAKLARMKVKRPKAYYLTSTVRPTDGEVRAMRDAFVAFHVLVLDDVGTKISKDNIPENLKPNYVIESSEGNEQWGFLLAEPITDYDRAQALIDLFVGAGLTDAGGTMPCKKVRLPAGVNGKAGVKGDFRVRLLGDINPEPWDVQALLDAAGIDVNWAELEVQPKAKRSYSGEREAVPAAQCADPVLEWLYDQGMVLEDAHQEWVAIKCPWSEKHSDDNAEAGYSPLGAGDKPDIRGYNCFHSHVHNTQQFLAWVAENGGPAETMSGYPREVEKLAFRIGGSLPVPWPVNFGQVQRIMEECFWMPKASRFNFLNRNQALVNFLEKGIANYLREAFGELIPDHAGLIEAALEDAGEDADWVVVEDQVRRAINNAVYPLTDYVRMYNQRSTITMRIDMFADRGSVDLSKNESVAEVVYPFMGLQQPPGNAIDAVVTEFKEHFPLFDDFIEFIAAARFAGDRKTAYLWLHCDSDWGKGLLLGALDDLGLVLELSTKEVEGMFDGKPVGRNVDAFLYTMVTAFDEFKSTKSEIKQLQRSVTFAPKHMPNVSAELFVKLFLSAEIVTSMVGDHGVEDQFVNRMSYYRGTGTILVRPVFKEVGSGRYRRALAHYMAERLNTLFAEYIELGRDDAEQEGNDFLRDFHKQYGIGETFDRLSETRGAVADDILEWISLQKHEQVQGNQMDGKTREMMQSNLVLTKGGKWLLKSPSAVVSKWIDNNLSPDQRVMVGRTRNEIYLAISKDGEGKKVHRIDKYTTVRGIWLRLTPTQAKRMTGAVPGLPKK
jgi:hypothetical protein